MRARARTERPLTPSTLERSALWHLQRRAMTEHELRDKLTRKARRAEAAHGPQPLATSWIDALVERLRSSLLLNDRTVAEARAASDARSGRSSRRIVERLRRRGVDGELIAEVVDRGAAADLDAALIYARKRRLDLKEPQKALATLARQGFSFDVAKRALSSLKDESDDVSRA